MKLKLTESQIDKVSDIIADIGLVMLASVVLPTILDKGNLIFIIPGIIMMLFAWYSSLWLLRK